MRKNAQGYYVFAVKNRRVRAGRFEISLRTKVLAEAEQRREYVRALIDMGDELLLEALRAGRLGFAELHNALKPRAPRDALERLRSDHVQGAAPAAIGEALEQTIAVIRGAHRRKNRVALYEGLERAMEPHHRTRLADYSTAQAQVFIAGPKGARWARSTQQLYRTLAKRVWADAIKAEAEEATRQRRLPRYTINPWDGVVLPQLEPSPEMVVLTHRQWWDVAEANAGFPNLSLMAVMALGGLRLGEARHLRDQDWDREKNELIIREHRGEYPWKPKKPRSHRRVAIMPELREILEAHRAAGFGGRVYLHTVHGVDRPLSESAARLRVKDAYTAAEIPYGRGEAEFTAHTLRHTAATWMIMANVPVTVVAAQLGDTPAVILSTYAHLFAGSAQDAMRTMSGILQGAAGQ